MTKKIEYNPDGEYEDDIFEEKKQLPKFRLHQPKQSDRKIKRGGKREITDEKVKDDD